MRILIIEDDEETARFLADGLRAHGHLSEVAKNGRHGADMAIRDPFDVIILDRMLPHLDGLGVVALTRSEGLSTPVLFLTNLSGIDDRGSNFFSFLVRSPNFQPRGAGHAVPQRANLAPGDVNETHVEEFNFWNRPAVQFLKDLRSVGALNLITVTCTNDRFPPRI